MQNPFQRLKHFRVEANDPKENHATETLAACLVFSLPFRQAFLEFLFKGSLPNEINDASQVVVETQFSTEGFGNIDLLMHTGEGPAKGFAVVVEVKVGSKEDKAQLDKYRDWLERKYRGRNRLFTLVRNPDPRFKHEASEVRRWNELSKCIEKFCEGDEDPTDKSLLSEFLDYLEMEGVIDNMDYTKLVDYGKGWAAEKALESLFSRTKELVKAKIPDLLEPRNFLQKRQPPSFQFGRRAWDDLFGKPRSTHPVWNNKVYAWFCTPATDPKNCKQCEFVFEIQLWNEFHEHDWDFTEWNLAAWLDHFGKRSDWTTGSYSKRGSWMDWNHNQTLDEQRRYCVELKKRLPVSVDQLGKIDGFALSVASQVVACIGLVDELRSFH